VALIKSSVLGCYTVSTGRFRGSEDAVSWTAWPSKLQ